MRSFGTHLNSLLDLLLRECDERKKEQKYATHKTFMESQFVRPRKHQLQHNISKSDNF